MGTADTEHRPEPPGAVPDLRAIPLGRQPHGAAAAVLKRVLAAAGTDIPAAAFQSSI